MKLKITPLIFFLTLISFRSFASEDLTDVSAAMKSHNLLQRQKLKTQRVALADGAVALAIAAGGGTISYLLIRAGLAGPTPAIDDGLIGLTYELASGAFHFAEGLAGVCVAGCSLTASGVLTYGAIKNYCSNRLGKLGKN